MHMLDAVIGAAPMPFWVCNKKWGLHPIIGDCRLIRRTVNEYLF
jgi:hypothetical protein